MKLSFPGVSLSYTHCNSLRHLPATPRAESEPPPEPPHPANANDNVELGANKTVTQHLGNAGFGAASITAFGDGLNTLLDTAANLPGAQAVPGLNLGVAAMEGYNSVKKLRDHEPIVAATAAGNAMGCLGTFLGQVSAAHALWGIHLGDTGNLLTLGATFGAVAGGLGIAAGVAEIHKGMKAHSSRTTAMGVLDITSGVTSLTGAAAMAGGHAGLGVTLMMAANLVDLTGIGVDYLWKRIQDRLSGKHQESTPPVPVQEQFLSDGKISQNSGSP